MKNKLKNRYQYNDLLIRSKDPYANAKYEIILTWLKKGKAKHILNAGCGSGELSFILSQNGYKVDSFDLDKDYINLAKKNVKRMKIENSNFSVSSVENYKNKSKYDAVIATDVLEHIENDKYVFSKLTTFLKKGGLSIITVPAGQYLFGLHDEKLGHFRRYSISAFKKIIPYRIKEIKIRYFGFFLIPIALIISRILRIGYPVESSGDSKKNFFIASLLGIFLKIEKNFSFPFGTSIIFIGKNS